MADGECAGNVEVAQAVRDESDDLLLPGRELRWSMSWPVTLVTPSAGARDASLLLRATHEPMSLGTESRLS
jgi:hypothetical protein